MFVALLQVMFGSQIGLEFAVPNATAESERRRSTVAFAPSHGQPAQAAGADAAYEARFGNAYPSSGLGGATGLGAAWTSKSQ